MLKDAPSSERIQELKIRHSKERLKDQEKITRLIDDVGHVEAAGQRETLNEPLAPPKIKTMDKNRFENYHLKTCYEDMFSKFDAIDTRANQVASERYNEYKEKKTLMLLQSKRECLGKLVAIQKQAVRGKTFNNNNVGSSTYRSSSRSSFSDSSSVASYATFNAPPSNTKVKAQQEKVGKNVPRLF
mmetsp:Transcript_7344/g.12338  ORF Transcript_7344/g.12338 Transcript_7344/m.12338 type:complete len:186 (+) Transcript_7344:96-653(+)